MKLYDEFPIVPHVPSWSTLPPVDPFKSVDIEDVIEELSRDFTPLYHEDCLKKFEVGGKNPRETYTVPLDNLLLDNQHVVGYILRNPSRVVEITINPVSNSSSPPLSRDYVGVFCSVDLQFGYATEENLHNLKNIFASFYDPRSYGKNQK